MLTLYIILWFLAGFVSLIGLSKMSAGQLLVGDILMAALFSFTGLIASIVLNVKLLIELGAFNFLKKRVLSILKLQF